MAIIKYRIEAAVTHSDMNYDRNIIESTWQYEEIEHPERGGKLLSREDALKLIREKGMIRALHHLSVRYMTCQMNPSGKNTMAITASIK